LRLDSNNPVTKTDKGKIRFVDYVLEMMELTDIEKLQVGSYEEGGLTFEQRKRLAIAVELAASPSVIFLDEPTSGLDSRGNDHPVCNLERAPSQTNFSRLLLGAVVIMRAMKKIADTGRTVCATIHQPSAAVFEMFDDLLLLKTGGEVVFFGECGEESCHLVDYFESQGAKQIEHGENPAAWMLQAYTREDTSVNWNGAFRGSAQYQSMKDTIAAIKVAPDESKKIEYDTMFAASWGTRMRLMNSRVFRIMMRAPSYNLARLMIAILYAFLVGIVFLRSRSINLERIYSENDVNGIVSTMFLSLIIMGVVSISMAVPVMKDMRDVFYKHVSTCRSLFAGIDTHSTSFKACLGYDRPQLCCCCYYSGRIAVYSPDVCYF
jgi:ABC-type multidrug transport system ATPase subunit